MEPIIGIMANAGAGKDTAADRMVAEHGWTKMSLADPIKRICKEVYDFSDEQLWGPSEMRNAPDVRYPRTVEFDLTTQYLSPRVALQICGTEFGRACYERTWVGLTIRNAKLMLLGAFTYNRRDGLRAKPSACAHLMPNTSGVVIPDCRFRNELDAIHKAGGVMVRLKRAGILKPGTVGVQGHASEMEQLSIDDSEFDYVIDVAEGISNFHKQIDDLMKVIKERK